MRDELLDFSERERFYKSVNVQCCWLQFLRFLRFVLLNYISEQVVIPCPPPRLLHNPLAPPPYPSHYMIISVNEPSISSLYPLSHTVFRA